MGINPNEAYELTKFGSERVRNIRVDNVLRYNDDPVLPSPSRQPRECLYENIQYT